MKYPAVFLDRDGTIIEDRGALQRPEDAVFFSDTVPALKSLSRFFKLFVVTHQPEVSRGGLSAADVERVNASVVQRLAREGVKIAEVYYCPHTRQEQCECIKPHPYFLYKAARDHDIDLSASFSIGDHPPDVEMGVNAGGCGVFVLTGHGRQHREELPSGTAVLPGIRPAAAWIIGEYWSNRRETAVQSALDSSAGCLCEGGLVVFPTETVYGLGVNAVSAEAVARVFAVKSRPRFDPLIVHIADKAQLNEIATDIAPCVRDLMDNFWPGPLSLVLPKRDCIPDLVTAGLPTVAVRMPCHPLALELIRRAGMPLAAPSANRFGHVSPTTVKAAREELGDAVDFYLDGGPCAVGLESTVISLAGEHPVLLRSGGVALEDIEKIIGPVQCVTAQTDGPAASPGCMLRHYAPGTPLHFWSGEIIPADASRAALLSAVPCAKARGFAHVEILSASNDPNEAALNLFAALRRLDTAGFQSIYAVPAPENNGLWHAVNDRLQRAAAPEPAKI